MAIRLSKDLSKKAAGETKPSNGYSLIFTPGKTYDLDKIFASRDRSSTEAALTINVKYYNEIAKQAIEEIIKNNKLYSKELPEETLASINETLNNTLISVMEKYGCVSRESLPTAAFADINQIMNSYLRKILKDTGKQFSIKFETNSDYVIINYDFADDETLNAEYEKYFNMYAEKLEDRLKVGEGELAITDVVKKKAPTNLDYKKYLLSEKSTKGYSVPLTNKRPIVVWENGTEDTTLPTDVETVYDTIDRLQKEIDELKNKKY